MPQPYKPLMPGDWRELENIIQEFYRILDVDTTLSTFLASSISGTANQVIVTDDGDSTVTLSTPQDIHTGASPTFVDLNLTGFLKLIDNGGIDFASVSDSLRIDDTFKQLVLSLDASTASGGQFIIGAFRGTARDYDHAPPTNPTLFGHSVTDPNTENDEWWSLTHDQTRTVIGSGSGGYTFPDGFVGIQRNDAQAALHVFDDGEFTARMIFETDNTSFFPGIQLQFDSTGTRRTLMRAAATNTLGTELQFFVTTDTGNTRQATAIDDDLFLNHFGGHVFQNLINTTTAYQWLNVNGDILANFNSTLLRVGIRTLPEVPFHVLTTSGASWPMFFDNVSANPLPGIAGRSARGTPGNETATQDDDFLVGLAGRGHTGSAFETSSPVFLAMKASENHSGTNQGTRIEFYTTPNLSTAAAVALQMAIEDTGTVRVLRDLAVNASTLDTNHGTVGIVTPVDEDGIFLRRDSGNAGDTVGLWFKASTDNSANFHKGALVWEDDGTGGGGGALYLAVDQAADAANALVADAEFKIDGSGVTHIGGVSAGTNETRFAADGSQSFAGTSRIDWAKIAANGLTKTNGTSPDAIGNLQTLDGTLYTLTEIGGGVPGIIFIVDYASVTAFNWVRILAHYSGSATHGVEIQLEITPFDGSAWLTLNGMDHHTGTNGCEDYSFFIPDDSIFINSGVVKLRFYHPSNGTPGHTLDIDEVSLYQ